jgi:enoyl-CoA hydratase/carnithine racemase|tara:strand:- start:257 stop:1039 length:783 start_codon:yes stop_codon:yes gene_type:complete
VREFTEIKYAVDEGIARVAINRPERLNALGMNLAEEFTELGAALAGEKEVRVVVLTGEGRAFSTGRDLKESATHTKEDADRYQLLGMETVTRWENLPMPTIAAINGHTFGWGMEISLACDIRLAAADATLCFPETALGVFPGAGGTVRLPRVIPAGLAKELIYTARRFDGEEAERIGFVNRAYPADQLMEEALALARSIAANGPLGVRGAKKVIEQTSRMPMSQAIEFSNAVRMPLNFTKDFAEALAAFKEKRKPEFRGE